MKNYSLMPNCWDLLPARGLKHSDEAAWLRIVMMCWHKDDERQTDYTVTGLARDCGWTESKMRRFISKLERLDLLQTWATGEAADRRTRFRLKIQQVSEVADGQTDGASDGHKKVREKLKENISYDEKFEELWALWTASSKKGRSGKRESYKVWLRNVGEQHHKRCMSVARIYLSDTQMQYVKGLQAWLRMHDFNEDYDIAGSTGGWNFG